MGNEAQSGCVYSMYCFPFADFRNMPTVLPSEPVKTALLAVNLDDKTAKEIFFFFNTKVDAKTYNKCYEQDRKWPMLEREVEGLQGDGCGAWGSPIYLKGVKRVDAKKGVSAIKDFYFRVKEVRAELRGQNNLHHKDTVSWNDGLKEQHAAWDKAFTTASENSPKESDEAIVDDDIAELLAEATTNRRLVCETSPPSDSFLALLATLLPLFFMLYWMFLRRVYYSAEKKPANFRRTSLSTSVFRDVQ